jgi:hypothetical protein
MTRWHVAAYLLGHVVGALMVFSYMIKELRALRERAERLAAYARQVVAPGHPPATMAEILDQVEANRPVGVSREAWFAECYQEMTAKMQRERLL